MTITLSPQTETLLREQANRAGQDADTFADTLLQDVLAEAARDFEESCAAISEALAGDPADDMPLEQYREQFEAQRAARRNKKPAEAERAA